MTEKINTGGSAFTFAYEDDRHRYVSHGMTLRDYFAAKAMLGYMSGENIGWNGSKIARESYALADAMLEVRGEK
jgi:hypothetical protein